MGALPPVPRQGPAGPCTHAPGSVRGQSGASPLQVCALRPVTDFNCEQGVKGGKWFSLIDKVYAPGNLASAFAKVKANKGAAGVDHQSVQDFERHLEANLARLSQALREGAYRPQALRRVWIPKPRRHHLPPFYEGRSQAVV